MGAIEKILATLLLIVTPVTIAAWPGRVAAQTPGRTPGMAPSDGTTGVPKARDGETLTDRLSRTEGVIKPPDNAPDMRVPAPNPQPNITPVIPPPGTPGGDQNVQPK